MAGHPSCLIGERCDGSMVGLDIEKLMVKLDGNMTMTGFCFENLRYGLALLADYITILRDMPGLFM